MSSLPRVRRPELMDQLQVEADELERSLADLRRVNRMLGGTRTVLRLLSPMLQRLRGRTVRVLDVATGSADIPCALAHWARTRDLALEILATDFHPLTLELARAQSRSEPAVRIAPANALALPFANEAFDLVMCNTALHHFAPVEAVQVLREMRRVARAGVVVTDLCRSRPALLGAQLLAATLWRRHPVTRHDGPSSVRAAFTPEELVQLAQLAGMEEARVRTHPVFRLSLVLDRTRGTRG